MHKYLSVCCVCDVVRINALVLLSCWGDVAESRPSFDSIADTLALMDGDEADAVEEER